MTVLHTTLGPRRRDEVGTVLPHEHLFVDLRTPDVPGQGEADEAEVVALMAPQVRAAQAQGVTAIVECSTGGVGRRTDLDLAVSRATGMPVVVASGIYREPWVPAWVRTATDAELEAHVRRELTVGVEGTGVLAAWVKLSAGDDGLTPLEERILRACARAAVSVGPVAALIGSHTIAGTVVLDQLRVLAEEGFPSERFCWIHTQVEPDRALHREVAARGAWIEYDHIGTVPTADVVDLVQGALAAGEERRLLLSHDAGWFDPAQPGGGTPRPWTALVDEVLPALRAAGVADATIHRLTVDNPFDAFAR